MLTHTFESSTSEYQRSSINSSHSDIDDDRKRDEVTSDQDFNKKSFKKHYAKNIKNKKISFPKLHDKKQ